LLLSFAFFGGLFNIIDRSIPKTFNFTANGIIAGEVYYNQVVDYFKFSFD